MEDTLKQLVIAEATLLKQNATQEEINKLTLKDFNGSEIREWLCNRS